MFPFDLPESVAINKARLEHLACLGIDLRRKTVLEPGCGIGLLTGFWEKRNCEVVSTDLQPSNVSENLRRNPNRKVLCRSIEPGFSTLGRFDVVFCYGILYHVRDPKKLLSDMAEVCDEYLFLETMVYPEDDGQLHLYSQPHGADQGIAGACFRPSRNWLISELKSLFQFVYVSKYQPDHPDFPESWPALPQAGVHRSIFVASRKSIESESLVECLPDRQYRQTVMFYSEHGEDRWLFENGLLPPKGVYVDIGAAWPQQASNTALLRDLGWSGIQVDGCDVYRALWEMQGLELIVRVIGNGPEAGYRINADNPNFSKITSDASPVPSQTINQLLDERGIGKIDVLSLDVEGFEDAILMDLDFENHLPRIIIWEYNTLGKIDARPCMLLDNIGYKRVLQTETNVIHVLE